MVVLATIATVVASQALISGAFSLTRQAVQLGYLPRVTIVHTSGKTEGQIYIPEVNWLLMVACVALVLGFRSSSDLAAAYGIAVTGTMAITSMLFYFVARDRWHWSRAARRRAGGAVPLRRPRVLRRLLGEDRARRLVPAGGRGGRVHGDDDLEARARAAGRAHRRRRRCRCRCSSPTSRCTKPHRVPGTAVFLSSTRRGTPNVLLHHFKHNKVLHKQVVILSIATDAVPEVADADKVRIKSFGQGFWAVTAHYGFMESPARAATCCGAASARGSPSTSRTPASTSGARRCCRARGHGMAEWRKLLFRFLSRNARSATDFFAIPPTASSRFGAQIELYFGTLEGSRAPRDGLRRAKPVYAHAIRSLPVGARGLTVASCLSRRSPESARPPNC